MTNLQDIDTLSADMTEELIFLVEMTTEHLGGLIDGVLNLHSNTPSGLGLFNNLKMTCWLQVEELMSEATYVKVLVVNFERGANINNESKIAALRVRYSHFS